MKEEFKKYFPASDYEPILRNLETNRYWINENLLKIKITGTTYNIAEAIIKIVDSCMATKQDAFQKFISICEDLQRIEDQDSSKIEAFILSLLEPNIDARLFEIVSYAILKFYYSEMTIFWGFGVQSKGLPKIKDFNWENLKLYKTGRTNANDGGIDFFNETIGQFFFK